MVTLPGKFRQLALLLLALLAACSTAQVGQRSSSISQLGPSFATVYFYRTHNSPGAVVGVDLKDNGIDIGTLQDGTYLVYHANPGEHVLSATTETTSTKNFNLQPGATYYIKADVVPSQKIFQPSLNVVFDLQGEAAVQNLRRLGYKE
jgi:Protein of unknown function (DUF2846)